MLKYLFPSDVKREIIDCNYNRHYMEPHTDRIMNAHDLIYFIDGEWEIYQDDIAYATKPGDLLLLSANHHHYGKQLCSQEVRTIYVHFNAAESDICDESLTRLSNAYFFPAHSHIPPNSQIPYLLKSLVSAYWQQNTYAIEQASAYLTLVLCELSTISLEKAPIINRQELVNRLCRTMASTPNQFYTVEELCALISVSRKTLYNYFTEVTGLSPHAWQIKSKLCSAKQLLEHNPQISMDDLVMRHGFCDEYYFSRLFKREFGVPPRKYGKIFAAQAKGALSGGNPEET